MTDPTASRRGFLGAAGLIAACPFAAGAATANGITPAGQVGGRGQTVPFYGAHQAGIVTALQNHTYFAAFDVLDQTQPAYGSTAPVRAITRADLARLFQAWTAAAARMAAGQPCNGDSGEALGLAPARLTLTFGLGPTLFLRDGQDRFGLAAQRPGPLVPLPRFHGDQLQPARTGGDLSVQACADDPQVAFHAVRQLARLGEGVVQLRWVQSGFSANAAARDTPRNLMGFRDGTQNPKAEPAHETRGPAARPGPVAKSLVWTGEEAPAWLRGGSYLVTRRIRVALEHWDRTDTEFQQQVIGRAKVSGAPLGGISEFDPLDLDARDRAGNPIIPETAHVRMASAQANDGAQILRRGYSYNDGANMIAERWPPWHQGLEYDAGLLFVAYQRDPAAGFIKLYRHMAVTDALNQFTTHTGGGLFAVPPGIAPGSYLAAGLF